MLPASPLIVCTSPRELEKINSKNVQATSSKFSARIPDKPFSDSPRILGTVCFLRFGSFAAFSGVFSLLFSWFFLSSSLPSSSLTLTQELDAWPTWLKPAAELPPKKGTSVLRA